MFGGDVPMVDSEAKVMKSIKVLSAKSGKYYYKSKDPQYYNNYFHSKKGPKTCEVCGTTVTCQLYSHKKSQKCQLVKQAIELEKVKREVEELRQRVDNN